MMSTRKRGEKSWDGNPTLSKGRESSLTTDTVSKLEEVRQALGSITAGGKMVQFLKHDENARELNALVDVIRGAIMDYQVYTSKFS